VGLLAILKAGGAYVPLDPDYPAERLAYMLQDSAPVVLLTDDRRVGLGPRGVPAFDAQRVGLGPPYEVASSEGVGVPIVDLQADAAMWADQPAEDLPRLSEPHHLAYIIYTSGSTGAPKGVMVEHRNVSRLFAATAREFGFGRDDVWTLFHSFAFDFSVWEIWGALLHGGKLVIVPQLMSRDPAAFHALLCSAGVTVLNQTPSAFRQLVAAQKDSAVSHRLRVVIFGGEALEMSSLKPWYAHPANARTQLINMYGITETTVHVTYCPLTPADALKPGPSPIGKRIADLRLYVLDAHREPVPIGVAGEMYVGGAGVARGYLNRPELSAERFLDDPFNGGRMYKTGDLGRLLPDGSVEYLGRNDFQVKVRGFRIELGEIEARLVEEPGIREAIVISREDSPGDQRLVAYCVADAELDAQQLRRQLAASLPEYMLPAAFVRLDRLPLTGTGKLDRQALPAPDASAVAKTAYEAPDGDTEILVGQLWSELLDVQQVGRHDDFFALGGHSLQVIRVIESLRREGLTVDARALFVAPTLAGFAAAIEDMEITL
jgi:amino acid adenylation domain-containing protein